MQAANTLGLDGDDAVDIVYELERAFGIAISDAEAESVLNAGDLFKLLSEKLSDASGTKCASAMTFYRLRRAFKTLSPSCNFKPDVRLSALHNQSPKSTFRQLGDLTDLKLPPLDMGTLGNLALYLMVAGIAFGFPLGWVASHTSHGVELAIGYAVVVICVVVALVRADPQSFGDRLTSVEDLVRRTAALNYAELNRSGARHNDKDLWRAMAEVLSSFAGTLTPDQISPETAFLQKQNARSGKT